MPEVVTPTSPTDWLLLAKLLPTDELEGVICERSAPTGYCIFIVPEIASRKLRGIVASWHRGIVASGHRA